MNASTPNTFLNTLIIEFHVPSQNLPTLMNSIFDGLHPTPTQEWFSRGHRPDLGAAGSSFEGRRRRPKTVQPRERAPGQNVGTWGRDPCSWNGGSSAIVPRPAGPRRTCRLPRPAGNVSLALCQARNSGGALATSADKRLTSQNLSQQGCPRQGRRRRASSGVRNHCVTSGGQHQRHAVKQGTPSQLPSCPLQTSEKGQADDPASPARNYGRRVAPRKQPDHLHDAEQDRPVLCRSSNSVHPASSRNRRRVAFYVSHYVSFPQRRFTRFALSINILHPPRSCICTTKNEASLPSKEKIFFCIQ